MHNFSEEKKLAIKNWNNLRKANRGKWITCHAVIAGRPLAIKSRDTWIQRCCWDLVVDGGPMECSVKDANDWLLKTIN